MRFWPAGAHALILALLILVGSCHRSSAADVSHVLPPQAMNTISTMFERMKPALRYTDIGIDGDHVLAHLCPAAADEHQCVTLRLEYPGSDCRETHWGQFCARFPEGAPSPALIAVIANALSIPLDQDVWMALAPPVLKAPEPPPRPRWADALNDVAAAARTLGTALALTLAPLGAGWLLGSVWRRRRRERKDGVLFAIAAIAVPAASVLALDARLELIGAWDALLVGIAAGFGLLLALHRAWADRKRVALMLASCGASLFAVELASRLLLPPPPAFPSSEGPALFLSDAMRVARSTGFAPTQAGIMTCYAIYGGESARNTTPPTAFPATWRPRPDAREHILHLGDSMVFGSSEDGRFTDDLNGIEPDVEHVNAAIPGTAPDVYLALARLFIARHDFTAVVMHLTPNDFWGVDEAQYPCSDWQPLLVYGPSGTGLRFPDVHPYTIQRSRLSWLLQNSPPPYVLRACVRFSSFAAHLAAALVHLGRRLGYMPADVGDVVREAHLAAILRDARDELSARHIPLVVDSFRERLEVESGKLAEEGVEASMKRIAEGLGIVTLDTWPPLAAAVGRGVQPFTNAGGPTDSHFNAQGHALIAAWLHEELPGAIDRARAQGDHQP
jgi:hypothetical protein